MVHQQRLMDQADKETAGRLATVSAHIELVQIVLKESRKAGCTTDTIAFRILHLGHEDHNRLVAETATISFSILCNKGAGLRNRFIDTSRLSSVELLVRRVVAGRDRLSKLELVVLAVVELNEVLLMVCHRQRRLADGTNIGFETWAISRTASLRLWSCASSMSFLRHG